MPIFPEETSMDLLLWRHAEAEQGMPDSKRQLTARGEKQAALMARWIKANAPKRLRIVASPATSTGGGDWRPRPFAASRRATAAALNASAPTPYTVSVGSTTSSPRAIA